MIELSCPACSAPFEVPDDAAPTVKCSYCGTSFIRRSPRRDTVTGLAVGAVALILGTVIAGSIAWYAFRNVRTTAPDMPSVPGIEAPPAVAPSGSELAVKTLTIGSHGEGPGRFDDNRTVAVDPNGRIYTAEYSLGRLQVFNPDGTFVAQWPLDDERVVLDLLADRRGRLYLLNPQEVVVYDTATGNVVQTIRDVNATDLALTLDNRILLLEDIGAVSEITGDGLELPLVSKLAEKTALKRVHFERMAVDASGDLLLTERDNPRVFRFTADGRYVDRFDATGLGSLNGVALDGLGRIFVSSVSGIGVFSPEGQRTGTVEQRQAFGIVFSDTGALFVAARPTIVEYKLTNS